MSKDFSEQEKKVLVGLGDLLVRSVPNSNISKDELKLYFDIKYLEVLLEDMKKKGYLNIQKDQIGLSMRGWMLSDLFRKEIYDSRLV